MDDERVGVGNVEAGLDDRGGEQDVVLALVEGRHDVFEFGRRQLAVGAGDLQFGHHFAQEFGDFVEVGDAWDDIEALAAASAFALQRIGEDDRIEGRDEGAHGEAIDRRRGDEREFAHAGERQLERARDRRGGECEHVDVFAQLLQALLVGDAEVLLLVDDDQSEAGEIDRLAEQRVRADDDIDLAILQSGFHIREILRRRRGARPARR